MRKILKSFGPTGLLLALASSPAAALTLDFEEFEHGDYVTSSQGVVITTTNTGGGPDIGLAFDTMRTGTADEDLQYFAPGISGGENGWRGGNLAPNTVLGMSLIIQEHRGSCNGVVCTNPDDEGSRPAGVFDLDYSALGTFMDFSMDLIDIESASAEPGSVEFLLDGVLVEEVAFMDFLSQPGFAFGDNSANHVDVVSGIEFDHVRLNVGGSGGFDNLKATQSVPEPTAALLFAAGMALAGLRIRGREAGRG